MTARLTTAAFGAILLTALLSTSAAATVHLLQQEADLLRIAYLADKDGSGTPPCAYKVLVGIPLHGEVFLTVVLAELARSARPGLVVEPCGPSSQEGPAFLGATAFLREQRVVEVWFSVTDQGGMGEYEQIVVDLHLPTAASATPVLSRNRAPASFDEELYAGAVLNYEQARRWRRSLRGSSRPKATVLEADGVRLRLSVRQTGIYEVSGEDLREAGLDLGDVSTNEMALLYGGGRALPREMGATSNRELQAVEILVEDGGDGRFDSEDSFLFYGESLSRWVRNPDTGRFEYIAHPYSRDNVYWLSLSGEVGARGTAQTSISDTPAFTRDTYRVRLHEEAETATTDVAEGNIQSGLEWYWEDFRSGDSETFGFVVRKPAEGPTTIRLRFVSRSESARLFRVVWNNRRIGTARFATEEPHLFEFAIDDAPLNGLNDLTLDNISGDLSLFDWYELEFDRQLEAEGGELLFDSRDSSGVVEYQLSGFTDPPRLFEVSDGLREIVNFAHDRAAGTVVFRDKAEPGRSYVAVTPSRVRKPGRVELIEQNDLNRETAAGADYLIISHGDFLDQAERLAGWRESDDRFGPAVSTAVVDVQDIYDSFSAGLFDPTAIRDFVRHTTLNWDPVPTFVLLFGDGSYDYKNNSGTSTGNWIPPYEDKDLTTDDWYVSVVGEDQLADLAVGRLPVQAVSEARTVVGKLIDYDSDPEFGDWQSRVLLVADDTFNADDRTLVETMFVNDSEEFASEFLPSGLDVEKLYLLEFPLEGRFKPRARDAFVERFNAGSLLLVYIGHGNAQVFAHEHIFVLSTDIDEIANRRRLPFLYTAASQMAVFDDPLRDSIPEALLKRHEGGIIGMVGATRVGFHRSNMNIARNFHRLMFRDGRRHVPVGLALMAAKAASDAEIRKILRYNLLGDPLMRLARPAFAVEIASSADTLPALGEVRVTGHLTDETGKLLEDFSGQVRLQVFDSTTRRVATDRTETIEYEKCGFR